MSKQKKKQMVSPQPKQARKNKKASQSSGKAAGPVMGSVPKGIKTVTAPVNMGLVSGRGQYAQITGRSKDPSGLEFITVRGHQLLQKAQLRNNSSFVLSDTSYGAAPGIPLSPYFVGGMCAKVAEPYSQYRFKWLKVVYVPMSSSQREAPISCGYQPCGQESTAMTLPEDEGGVAGALFRSIGTLASMATGSVWTEIALEVGKKVGAPLVEAAIKWWQTNKPMGLLNSEMDDEENIDGDIVNNRLYIRALNTFLIANAAALPNGTRPADPGASVVAGITPQRIDAIRRRGFQILKDSMANTVQGVLFAATDAPYGGTVAPDGTAPAGEFYIDYEMELSAPQDAAPSTLDSRKTADPLDDDDPTDPLHSAYTPVARSRYLWDSYNDGSVFDAPPPLAPPHNEVHAESIARCRDKFGSAFTVKSVRFIDSQYETVVTDRKIVAVARAVSRKLSLAEACEKLLSDAGFEDRLVVAPTRTVEWDPVRSEAFKVSLALPGGSRLSNRWSQLAASDPPFSEAVDRLRSCMTAFSAANDPEHLPASFSSAVRCWLKANAIIQCLTPKKVEDLLTDILDPWMVDSLIDIKRF